ncbi:MAG: hypothetical protein KGJ46_10960, partial [Xanthomonadaceae bacterium]|nr:hypothetical protein [Xanthomonadaceae bacterium]
SEQRAAHFSLAKELFQRLAITQEDLPDGYAIQFPASAYEDIVRFVGNERRCCPAIRFEIEVCPAEGPVTLQLKGPEGAREFLKAELPLK